MRTGLVAVGALFVAFVCVGQARADMSCGSCSADAVAIARSLSVHGFGCDFLPVSAQRGFRCQGHVADYSMPVDIFVAPGFSRAAPMELAYHLHGWWTDPRTTPFDGPQGDFGAFVARSGRNLILVVPESRGKNATYATDLNTAAKTQRFFAHIEDLLRAAGAPLSPESARWISAHSGAYVALGRIGEWSAAGDLPGLEPLRAVILLDTAYGYRAGLVRLMDVMCAGGSDPRVSANYLVAYNPNNDAGKRATNERLLREVTARCPAATIVATPDPKTTHVDFPMTYLPEFFKIPGP